MIAVNTKNQFFAVWDNDLKGRINPHYYKPIFKEKLKELLNSPYKIVSLKDICIKISDGTHFTPKYTKEGIRFLSVKDVRENHISFDKNVKFISPEEHKTLIKRCKPKPDDILLTKVGTVGLSVVIPKDSPEFSIFVSLALLRVNKKQANPYYVSAYLNSRHTKIQIDRVLKGIGVPDLHLENIADIKIPLPPLDIQNQIIEIMQSAYREKAEKEQGAEKLLSSIDDYVLEELGIEITELKEKMCYKVNSEKTEQTRIDATYWKPKFQQIKKLLKNCQYPVKGLTEISQIQRGILIPPKKYEKGKKNYIRIADLGNLEINPAEIMKVDFESKKGRVVENEILFTAIGATIGKVALIDSQFSGSYFSNNLTKIIPKKVNPYYLLTLLASTLGQEQIKRYSTQTAQPKINNKELAKIQVSLPHLEVQQKIAKQTKYRIEKHKQLKSEAKNRVDEAKKEVENIILNK